MRTRFALSATVWVAALACVAIGGVIACLFVLMATSKDTSQMITQGVEPWSNAAIAAGAFVGLLAVTLLGLALWRTARFKAVGLVLVLLACGLVVWASALVYREYW